MVPASSLVGEVRQREGREDGEIGKGGGVSARQTKPWLFQGCHVSRCPQARPHAAVFAQACPHYEWLLRTQTVNQGSIQKLKAGVNISTARFHFVTSSSLAINNDCPIALHLSRFLFTLVMPYPSPPVPFSSIFSPSPSVYLCLFVPEDVVETWPCLRPGRRSETTAARILYNCTSDVLTFSIQVLEMDPFHHMWWKAKSFSKDWAAL